jgi:methionyl aminopeptidase
MKNLSSDAVVKDVGNFVNDELEKQNVKRNKSYSLIHSLCGHGLGKNLIHTGTVIPNYKNTNTKKLNELAFAIEPFITDGNGEIYEGSEGNIYSINSDGQVRDRDARKMLEYIKENYKTRPFCERWLKKAGFLRTKYCLKVLKQSRIIYEYPMLIETGKGVVSQFENTFIITENKVICISENIKK